MPVRLPCRMANAGRKCKFPSFYFSVRDFPSCFIPVDRRRGLLMPNDNDADRAARCQQALQIAREADSFQAIAFLESRHDVLAVGQDYSELVRSTYADKDVAGMILLGLAGMHFCLAEAQRRHASEPENSAKLK